MTGPDATPPTPARRRGWGGLPVTTDSVDAARAYAAGVDLLFGGELPSARVALDRALLLDDGFMLAHAAVAVVEVVRQAEPTSARDRAAAALERARGGDRCCTRRERQHVELVSALVEGDRLRWDALLAEHRAEFPTDPLCLLDLSGTPRGTG